MKKSHRKLKGTKITENSSQKLKGAANPFVLFADSGRISKPELIKVTRFKMTTISYSYLKCVLIIVMNPF